ncbi:uncharacterized protein [Cherax quadricarinatus]
MAPRQRVKLQLVLLGLLVMDSGGSLDLADTHHFQPSSGLRWASSPLPRQLLPASLLPRQQLPSRQHLARPIIPDGGRKFQVYVYGEDGQLAQKWISLQDIQDLLLALGPHGTGQGGSGCVNFYNRTGELTPVSQPRPSLPTRPQDNIQGVIAIVQQVVSSEVAQSQQQPPVFPANLTENSGESIEIPETILHNLLSIPHHLTTQWQFPSTFTPSLNDPSTLPQAESTATTSDQPTTTDITTTFPEVTTVPDTTGEVLTIELSDSGSQVLKLPGNDRWNSRFPGFDPLFVEEDEGNSSTRQDLEPTNDYHSNPSDLLETVIPSNNEATPDGGFTLWNYTTSVADAAQEPGETTTLHDGNFDYDISTVVASTTDKLHQVTYDENNNLLSTRIDAEDPLLSTLTDLYAQSYNNDNPPQPLNVALTTSNLDQETLAIQHNFESDTIANNLDQVSTATQHSFESDFTTNDLVQETTTTQHYFETDSSTHSPFQSAFIDFATNVFLDNTQMTLISETPTTIIPIETQTTPIAVTASSRIITTTDSVAETSTVTQPSVTHHINTYSATGQPDRLDTLATANSDRTSVSLDENLLSLDIRNPSLPQSPYDIIPAEDTEPSSTTLVSSSSTADQKEKPYAPYDGPAALLAVSPLPNNAHDGPQNEFAISVQHAIENLNEVRSPQPTLNFSTIHTQGINNQNISIGDLLTQYFTTTQESLKDDSADESTMQDSTTPASTTQDSTTLALTTQYLTTVPAAVLRPQHSLASEELHRPGQYHKEPEYKVSSDSSVLPASQLAGSGYQDRIDLEALQANGNLTEGDNFYDYYGAPVYLDNIPEDYYNYDVDQPARPVLNDTQQLDFPGPNATTPYHDHHDHHGDHHHEDHHHGDHHDGDHHHHPVDSLGPPEPTATLLKAPKDNPGLEASVEGLHPDVREFVDVMNNITFEVYKRAASHHKRRNFVMSPLSLISTLGMLLIGARGSSSGALSDLLQMDKFFTFNPHLILKNVTQSVQETTDAHDVVLLNQFLVEKEKNPYSTDFFARTIKVFYDAVIEDVDPGELDDTVRRRVNDLVRSSSKGKVDAFLLENEPLFLTPPLTAVATSFFHARWSLPVLQQDLIDMSFIRFPTAERRLIRTVGLKKKVTINAGFSHASGVTSAEIPLYSKSGELSLVLVMPGEQKNFVANGLAQLEATLTPERWSQALRSMLPNTVLLKMPVFRHRAFHNFSSVLADLGLVQLFQEGKADFSGINHVKNLHLSDVVQLTEFQSCQVEDPPIAGAITSRRSRKMTLQEDDDGVAVDPRMDHQPTYIYGFPMVEYLQLDKVKLTRMEPAGGRYDDIFSHYFPQQASSPDRTKQQATLTDKTEQQTSSVDITKQQAPSVDKTEQQASSSDTDFQQGSSTDNISQQVSSERNTSRKASSTGNSPHNASSTDYAIHQTKSDSSPLTSPPSSLPQQTTLTSHDSTEKQMEKENGNPGIIPTSPEYPYYKNNFEEASMYLGSEDYRIDRMGAPAASDDTKRPSSGAFYRQSDVGTLAFDRAFLYAVRHNPTGLLLFIGRYLDPEGN